MSEMQKTLSFVGAAILLAAIAFLLVPNRVTPDAFLDQGEKFFPDFTDPNEAITLEVMDYDEETGSARPFKVTFEQGRWIIPSHHNYPADAKDRLAKTAAGIIDLRKDDFRTDKVADHEECGVIDPLDESSAGLAGRGKRITLRGQGGVVLADYIVGKEVLSNKGYRFVRIPGQSRVYASKTDVDISTNFKDWIDPDLLRIDKAKVNKIVLNDYSINERTRSVDQRTNVTLTRVGDKWSIGQLKSGQIVDSSKVQSLLTALDSLSIVGVRPKPEGLSASLGVSKGNASISQADQISLQSKGYYLSRNGQLLSNEGELQIWTDDGIRYTLRFGEVLFGSGLSITSGSDDGKSGDKGRGSENRYLFATVDFVKGSFGKEPPKPSNTDFMSKPDSLLTDSDRKNKNRKQAHDKWQSSFDNGKSLSEVMGKRFAPWYYVISSSDFESLNLSRKDLVKKKES